MKGPFQRNISDHARNTHRRCSTCVGALHEGIIFLRDFMSPSLSGKGSNLLYSNDRIMDLLISMCFSDAHGITISLEIQVARPATDSKSAMTSKYRFKHFRIAQRYHTGVISLKDSNLHPCKSVKFSLTDDTATCTEVILQDTHENHVCLYFCTRNPFRQLDSACFKKGERNDSTNHDPAIALVTVSMLTNSLICDRSIRNDAQQRMPTFSSAASILLSTIRIQDLLILL